jgi:hypothetical protein
LGGIPQPPKQSSKKAQILMLLQFLEAKRSSLDHEARQEPKRFTSMKFRATPLYGTDYSHPAACASPGDSKQHAAT